MRILANGYIVTSLLWASALAAMIDRRLQVAAAYFAVAACGTLFGVIHSPLPGSPRVLALAIDVGDAGVGPALQLRLCPGGVDPVAVSRLQPSHSWPMLADDEA